MLDVSADNLLREITACVKLRDHHVNRAREILEGYVGFDFNAGRATGRPSPENHAFEYMTLMLGRLVADNPAIAIRAPFAQYEWTADALEDAGNQWIVRNNLQAVLEGIVAEALICFGVGMVSFDVDLSAAPTPDGARRMRPYLHHIPFWRYFRDAKACNGIPARLEGHLWQKDKEDLLNDPRYDPDLVEKLMEEAGEPFGTTSADHPDRRQVTGYEVWIPDAKLPDGYDPSKYHGVVYTVGTCVGTNTGKDKPPAAGYLRQPQPFFGPASGPYKLFGGWPVPGSPYRLAPLMATKEQAEEHNAHMNAITHSALQRKTVIVTNAANTALKNTLKNAQDGHVYGVKGYQSGQFDQIEIGGPSAQQLDYEERVRERLDRNLGMSDAQRGQPRQGVTATADQISANSANIRTESYQTNIRRAVADCMRNVVWYMYQSEFFVTRLSDEWGRKYGVESPGYSGGEHEMTAGLSADDLITCLDIQPYSMERVDPVVMQGRMQQLVPLAISIAQAQAAMPYANFSALWDQLARAHNFTWLKSFIDEQKLAEFVQMQAQAAAAGNKKPLVPYDKAPSDIKMQMEAVDGYQPSALWPNYPLFAPGEPKGSGNPVAGFYLGLPEHHQFAMQQQAAEQAQAEAQARNRQPVGGAA